MQKPTLTIFFQFNPWRTSLGGVQTIVRSFIKYAPDTFNIRLVGTGNEQIPAKKGWQEMELEGRSLQFLPIFDLPDDNHRRRMPTTVSYTAALMKHHFIHRDCASDFMHFHRLEPAIASQKWPGEKTFSTVKQRGSRGELSRRAYRPHSSTPWDSVTNRALCGGGLFQQYRA